jgi:hypothetical protein
MTFIDRHWSPPSGMAIRARHRDRLRTLLPWLLLAADAGDEPVCAPWRGPHAGGDTRHARVEAVANRPLLKALGAALALVALLVGTGSLALPGQAGVLSRGVAFASGDKRTDRKPPMSRGSPGGNHGNCSITC